MDNSNMLTEGEADGGDMMTDKNSGSGAVAQVTGDNISSGVCLSSLWLDDHDLRVGLCFKDVDELKKAVDWYSISRKKNCVVKETGKDECMYECVRWKCKWSLVATRMEKHRLLEIVKYIGPHTCYLKDPEDFESEFDGEEFERVVSVHPTKSFAELKKRWKDKSGYELQTKDVRGVKVDTIKSVFGDWDQCFEDLPKLMSAFSSSNGLLVDWKYDVFPNLQFASFCGVFWAFSQSIQGFEHCRPLIVVGTKELKGKCRFSLNCGDVYTKPVTDKLEEFRKASVAYAVVPLDNNAFQVAAAPSKTDEWIVQLNDSTCTCGDFQSNKFPCLHALAVCKKLKINPLQYVDDCYTCEWYYKTYAATFSPVPELSAWPEASGVPRLFPPVIPPPPPPHHLT